MSVLITNLNNFLISIKGNGYLSNNGYVQKISLLSGSFDIGYFFLSIVKTLHSQPNKESPFLISFVLCEVPAEMYLE